MDSSFEEIRKLAITALVSDEVLFEHLVLKGGNAMALVHRLDMRASLDLDFSIKDDFENPGDIEQRAKSALENRYAGAGLKVIDFSFVAKPKLKGPDERPWWGGYEIEFKLLRDDDFDRLRDRPQKMSMAALPIGPKQLKRLRIDISKNEYVEGRVEEELDYYPVRVYTPAMVACEKLRALCQQMPEYPLRPKGSARARDFYDIFIAVTVAGVDLQSAENVAMLGEMFAAKQVDRSLLERIATVREDHRPDWESVKQSVSGPLEEFDHYFDFVVDQVERLKPLWNV